MLGVQKPSQKAGPAPLDNAVFEDALVLLSACKMDLDPWQRTVLRQMLGLDRMGKYISSRVGFSVPRQNGKSALIEARVLAGLFVMNEKLILVAAHELSTTDELFLRIKGLIESQPSLEDQVEIFRSGNGKHAIELKNGQRVRFIARTKNSGRGLSADALILDEAQELSDLSYASLEPTTSARPNPQIVLTGTVPGPDNEGDVFRRIRDSALKGTDPRVSWMEWSAPEDASMDDPSAWAQANPAMGYRLTEMTIRDSQSLGEDFFSRERLGIWREEIAGSKALDFKRWSALKIKPELAPTEGRVVYGVKFSHDGREWALSVARRPEGSKVIHVEGIKVGPMIDGTSWLVAWLAERAPAAAQIVVDGKSGSGALATDLKAAGVRGTKVLIFPSLEEIVTAHSMLLQSTIDGTISHIGQTLLDNQAKGATRRKIGDKGSFGWQAPKDGSVCMLDSITLSHWGAVTTKRNPGGARSARSGGRAVRGRKPAGRGGR